MKNGGIYRERYRSTREVCYTLWAARTKEGRGVFYIFHGEDEFSRAEEVARLKALVAREGAGDLNTTVLDGRRLALGELMNACNALPFLAGRRLVIVNDFLQRLGGRRRSGPAEGEEASEEAPAAPNEETAALLAYLPHLPPTTRLVFVESVTLPPNHPVLKYAQGNPQGHVRAFPLLNPRQEEGRRNLAAWIRRRAKEKGVEITAPAVAALVELVGGDLRALDQELEKLAAHAAYERAITLEDVRALTSAAQEANIFDLMDALGLRQRKEALALTARLFAERANELYLLTMIARQVRLILLVKEMTEEKRTPSGEIAKSLSLRPFMVTRLLRQAQQFSAEELERLLGRILEIDQAIKTGRIEGRLALDLLVLEMCQRRPAAPSAAYQGSRASRTR